MSGELSGDPPFLQRLYDKIWLLAVAAFIFWVVAYIVWGYLDLFAVPGMVIPAEVSML